MEQSRIDFITDMHLKSPKDSYLAFAAAVEHQLAGNRQRAIDIIENLIENDPDYTDAYFRLGKMYENSNRVKKAVSTYHAGKKIATKHNDEKSLGEITEALMFMDEEEGNW
jgi:tetratricopeptide (TPR) repeat protein